MGYKLTGMYIGQDKVRPTGGWTPSATCVAYYKLEDDFLDYSGNGYDLTNSGMVLGTTSDGYKAGQLGLGQFAYTTAFDFGLTSAIPRTIAFWEGCSSITVGSWSMASILKYYTADANSCFGVTTYDYSTWGLGNPRGQNMGWRADTQPKDYNMSLIDANNMHSYVFAVDSNGASWYKDGVLVGTDSSIYETGNNTGFVIGNNVSTTDPSRNVDGYIRHVVIDAGLWTAQDVLDYHNGTA